jgi:manganese transport protein
VALSFALPFALVPLLLLTGNRDVMKQFVNNRWTHWLGWLTISIITVLNVFLLWQAI